MRIAQFLILLKRKTLAQRVRSLFSAGEQGVWYDPSDFSTLFQDAGTTPVTAAGQTVALMRDKSGRGNHLTLTNCTLQTDTSGLNYIAFNGTTSSAVTAAIDFTATDKMTVVAGIRKLNATAAFNVFLETGANGVSGFGIFAPDSNNNDYAFWLKGQSRATAGSYVAPISNVLSVRHDCSQATAATQTRPRVNGTPLSGAGTISAAGNFANEAIHLGARAGTSLFFNGRLYSLIARGALSTDAQIVNTERYVNSKTGAY